MSAYIYANGNAIYFDHDGKQMPDIQKLGWAGLGEYLKQYPRASVEIQGGFLMDQMKSVMVERFEELKSKGKAKP